MAGDKRRRSRSRERSDRDKKGRRSRSHSKERSYKRHRSHSRERDTKYDNRSDKDKYSRNDRDDKGKKLKDFKRKSSSPEVEEVKATVKPDLKAEVSKREPLSLEELLAKKKAEEAAKSKVCDSVLYFNVLFTLFFVF